MLSPFIRFGADGLARVTTDGEDLLVDASIRSATSDGSGGVLYVRWEPGQVSGTTWWLPSDTETPGVVSDGFAGLAARLDDRLHRRSS